MHVYREQCLASWVGNPDLGLRYGVCMQRRLSFGCSESIGTPGRINMSRRLSMASDGSTGSGAALRKHDCQLGELHSAYEDLCKKVSHFTSPCTHFMCISN